MRNEIWRQLIQILSFRKDLIETIKPFFGQLYNKNKNEKYNINDKKNIPFLKSFLSFQLQILHEYEIIDEEIYLASVQNRGFLQKSCESSLQLSNNEEEKVREIIKGDKLEELQKLIREKDKNAINPIIKSFNEIKLMKIPIIIECIIQKAIKCFKYLLINGIEDPTLTMQDQNPEILYNYSDQKTERKRYEWDCMAVAIYYGEMEIVKILEEKGIEKENNPKYINAAIFAYRNRIAKEIIKQLKEKNENKKRDEAVFLQGLIASAKNNNIEGAEMLINNGADINAKEII